MQQKRKREKESGGNEEMKHGEELNYLDFRLLLNHLYKKKKSNERLEVNFLSEMMLFFNLS